MNILSTFQHTKHRQSTAAILLSLFMLFFAGSTMATPIPANVLVEKIDSFRGLGTAGFSFEITNISFKNNKKSNSNKLSVAVQDDNSLVKFESPARQRGRVLLKKADDMWLYVPGTRKVIRISPAQRLLGETSNGDVVGSNFSGDYDAAIVTTEQDKQNGHIKLELTANKRKLSYQKVVFWLTDDEKHKPVRSEYFARSGKLLKIAHYKDFKDFGGQLMIHKMLLEDPLIKGSSTWMMFDNYRPTELPLAMFNKEAIVNL